MSYGYDGNAPIHPLNKSYYTPICLQRLRSGERLVASRSLSDICGREGRRKTVGRVIAIPGMFLLGGMTPCLLV